MEGHHIEPGEVLVLPAGDHIRRFPHWLAQVQLHRGKTDSNQGLQHAQHALPDRHKVVLQFHEPANTPLGHSSYHGPIRRSMGKSCYWDEQLEAKFTQAKNVVCHLAKDGLAYFECSRPTIAMTD